MVFIDFSRVSIVGSGGRACYAGAARISPVNPCFKLFQQLRCGIKEGPALHSWMKTLRMGVMECVNTVFV
jgi:hypothetical protein